MLIVPLVHDDDDLLEAVTGRRTSCPALSSRPQRRLRYACKSTEVLQTSDQSGASLEELWPLVGWNRPTGGKQEQWEQQEEEPEEEEEEVEEEEEEIDSGVREGRDVTMATR